MSLRWRRHLDPLGARGLVEVYWQQHYPAEGGWPEDHDPKATLAHSGFELVAALLAEPLRRAFHEHLAEHGCADPDRGGHGFGHCPEAMRRWELLPDGDRVLLA